MNKRLIVIIFSEIIHKHLKTKKPVDGRNRPQIVRTKLTVTKT